MIDHNHDESGLRGHPDQASRLATLTLSVLSSFSRPPELEQGKVRRTDSSDDMSGFIESTQGTMTWVTRS